MAAHINIIGNLGADAEQSQAGDVPVVRWRVASTTKGRNGAPDHTVWFSVTIWRGWDSHAAARKGDPVAVNGELASRDYQGQTQFDVSAQPWLCQAPRRESQGDQGGQRQQQPAKPAQRSNTGSNTNGGWGGGNGGGSW